MDSLSRRAPDDLAWSPVRPGGAAFGTHRLIVSADRLEFRPSAGSMVLIGVFASAGVGSMIGGAFHGTAGLLVGGMMLLTSVILVPLLAKTLLNRRVFDRGLGLYWDTRDRGAATLKLGEVRGVQIVRERVIGPDSDYDADELNLVLEGGRRINVIDHGDTGRLREDATRVAQWLGVPLWAQDSADAADLEAASKRPRS